MQQAKRAAEYVFAMALEYCRWALQLVIVNAIGLFWSFGVCAKIASLIYRKPRQFFSSTHRKRPRCLDDRLYGAHGFAKINKHVQLHYVISGPYEAPYIVFLHGFPEFWYSWRHQIAEFNRDYRVVAVDLTGYGESAKPSSVKKYLLDRLVEDLRGLLQYLGVKECYMVGHDWGGALTWRFCEIYPELVKKAVILNCPHPAVMTWYITTNKEQFLRSWYMFFFNIPWLPEWFFWSGDRHILDTMFQGDTMGAKKGAFTVTDMECFKYTYSSPGRFSGPMNYIRAALRYTKMSKILPENPEGRSNVPTLLLWGTRDAALCQQMAELSACYTSQFQLQLIEGASHWVQQDEPDLVNSHIRDFIDTAPSEIRDTAPSKLRDTAPSELRDTAPSELRDTAPSELRDRAPSELREGL